MSSELMGTSLLDPQLIDDPLPLYHELLERAPVWRVPGTDIFTASSFAVVAEAVSRTEEFSSNLTALLYRDDSGLPARLTFGGAGVDVLATADPPVHAVHRKVVFPNLVAHRMTQLRPEIAAIADRCIERVSGGSLVEFMGAIGNLVPITVVSRLVGFTSSDPERLLTAAFDSTELLAATIPLERLQVLLRRTDDIGGWIARQLTEAPVESEDQILGTIARGIEASSVTLEEGVVVLHTLLSAGGESTTSLLGNSVRVLAERPELQHHLRNDPRLIPAFVEEVLRLESPFRYHMRSVTQDTSLNGVDLPAEATVLLLWGAANRDPLEHEQPDDIVLSREAPRHHLAFGRGIHHCVGAPLARLEAEVVLSAVLAQTENFALEPDQPPERVNSLMVRRHQRLPIRITWR